MRLDRHDKLAKSLKLLKNTQTAYWESDKEKIPHYCLKVHAAAPNYMLRSIDNIKAGHSRAVAAHLHWRALQTLLNTPLIDVHKGAFVGIVFGFPEFIEVSCHQRNQHSRTHFFIPLRVSFEYQKQPIEWRRFEIDTSWLLACNEIDLTKSNWIDLRESMSELEDDKAHERAINWVLQTQLKSSQLFSNRNLPVWPLWKEFLCYDEGIACRPSTAGDFQDKALPFTPSPKATLGQSLMDVRNYIADSPSIHYERLARHWLYKLTSKLFFNTKLTEKQRAIVLGYFGMIDRDCNEKQICGLILDASAYPVDVHRAVQFIDALYDEFTADIDGCKRSGELILVILIAIQAAYRKPRWICVNEILDLTSQDWDAASNRLNFQNCPLEVCEGLATVINAFVPVGEKQKRRIFKISRSWINEHLRDLNIKLGYDKDNDPVTIQTFLARPESELGRRGKPLLWRLGSRIQMYQYRQLFPAPQKVMPPATLRQLSNVSLGDKHRLPVADRIIRSLRSRNLPRFGRDLKVFKMNVL